MSARGRRIDRSRMVTPIGALAVFSTEEHVLAVEFEDQGRAAPLLERQFSGARIAPGPMPSQVRDALEAYFADGSCDGFDRIRLKPAGTGFQRRVWSLVREIPAGQILSYGALASALGCPGAARAVGAANGSNPIPLFIPCHRVIGANGRLTGYGSGIERKAWLLRLEGAAAGWAHEGGAELPFRSI